MQSYKPALTLLDLFDPIRVASDRPEPEPFDWGEPPDEPQADRPHMYKGTSYAVLKELRRQNVSELPAMTNGVRIELEYLQPVAQDSRIRTKCEWSNDDLLNHTGFPDTRCNYNIGDKDPEKLYNFRCLEAQHVYTTQYNASLFDFRLKNVPDKSALKDHKNPYTYVNNVTICGREMNLSNMYISYHLALQLESTLIQYINHTFDVIMRRNVLSQLITAQHPIDSVKLQMIVKDEYFYWSIFTLLDNYEQLKSLGLSMFKFSYLLGERKMNHFSEIFPRLPREGELFETYNIDGRQYRREVLHAPTIVMYLNVTTIEPLIRFLQTLFPVPISKGEVPRFNYRIDDNLFFSVEGHNQYKFDIPGVPPEEYQRMLSNPAKYEDYNEFSRYISGHDVLDGSHPNNIRSYHHLFQTQTSFRTVYESVGLLEDYQNMWVKLGLPPILDVAGGNFLKPKRKTKRTKRTSGTKRKYARKQVSRKKLRK
jgi:hypothetical protein